MEKEIKISELARIWNVSVNATWTRIKKEGLITIKKMDNNREITFVTVSDEILNKYMPEQLSEEEVLKVIDEAFDTIKPQAQSDMGKLMGFVNPKLKGKADMSFVSKTIKERLSSL